MSVSGLIKVIGDWGGYAIARAMTGSRPRILMYHRFSRSPLVGHVSADEFEWQVRYIAKHFQPLSVSQVASSIRSGKKLPRNSIAISVDDGYSDFYSIAWPILKKYNVPATFYVTTGFVNGDFWLWPDQLRYLLERAPEEAAEYDFDLFSVRTPLVLNEMDKVYWGINQTLLQASDSDMRRTLTKLAQAWNIALPCVPPVQFRSVTWDQLIEMQAEGLEVGGHTVSHPSLGRVSSAQARAEILGCADMLVKHLGQAERSFCYPNGTPCDFVGSQVRFVEEAGFNGAVVAFADSRENAQLYAMRRHSSSSDRFQFLKAVTGIELLGMKVRKVVRETPYG